MENNGLFRMLLTRLTMFLLQSEGTISTRTYRALAVGSNIKLEQIFNSLQHPLRIRETDFGQNIEEEVRLFHLGLPMVYFRTGSGLFMTEDALVFHPDLKTLYKNKANEIRGQFESLKTDAYLPDKLWEQYVEMNPRLLELNNGKLKVVTKTIPKGGYYITDLPLGKNYILYRNYFSGVIITDSSEAILNHVKDDIDITIEFDPESSLILKPEVLTIEYDDYVFILDSQICRHLISETGVTDIK